MNLAFGVVNGLPEEEQKQLNDLARIYNYHHSSNRKKRRYYEGKVTLNEVNIGIAIPREFGRLQVGCSWGAKTVDVLASRSIFDGFVSASGNEIDEIFNIMQRNNMISEYNKATKEELKYGCAFAVVYGDEHNARIRFYSPLCAAARWNGQKGDIDCGIAFDDSRKDESDLNWNPEHVNFYTDTDIWQLDKIGGVWMATQFHHRFGRPLMVPMIWDATADKPFGQSRLKEPVRRLIEGYVRTVANATIGLEFATSPQKYLLGVTEDQYDFIVSDKFRQYVGSILAATDNPETGERPQYGQLPQGNIQPHVDMLRMLATQYSAATGLSVTDTGVVNDANPTSSDAILAQTQTLVLMAEQLNQANADALYMIMLMALAIEQGTTPDQLTEDLLNMVAHFKNPAMPSVASTADAAIKIASAREGFSSTDTFLMMIGFSQADIRRIKNEEKRFRGMQLLTEVDNVDIDTGLD